MRLVSEAAHLFPSSSLPSHGGPCLQLPPSSCSRHPLFPVPPQATKQECFNVGENQDNTFLFRPRPAWTHVCLSRAVAPCCFLQQNQAPNCKAHTPACSAWESKQTPTCPESSQGRAPGNYEVRFFLVSEEWREAQGPSKEIPTVPRAALTLRPSWDTFGDKRSSVSFVHFGPLGSLGHLLTLS